MVPRTSRSRVSSVVVVAVRAVMRISRRPTSLVISQTTTEPPSTRIAAERNVTPRVVMGS